MNRQRGVAIVAVLIVVAIIATIAASAMLDQQVMIRRAENMLHGQQASLHLLSLENWAKEALIKDAEDSAEIDHYGEDWATRLEPVETDGGVVAATLKDLQGRFNLNLLYGYRPLVIKEDVPPDPETVKYDNRKKIFECLLEQTAKELVNPEVVSASLIDWMDANQDLTPRGAEDLDYLSLDPPYRTASRPLTSASELRLMKGMNADAWEMIEPFVTALPAKDAGINVNTAPLEIMRCIDVNIDESTAQHILDEREVGNYFSDWQGWWSRVGQGFPAQPLIQPDEQTMSVVFTSDYFLLESGAAFGDLELTMLHLLERTAEDDTISVRTVMRAYGDQL